jgi:17beta-estradiol 17-dehydrogenase/3beta-hydroxysteroid 3-dehydrogenase
VISIEAMWIYNPIFFLNSFTHMTIQKQKVAIVTGANGGVGTGLCRRLLEMEHDIKLVMACRNYEKAYKKKCEHLRRFPNADIDIELVDLESVASVLHFCSAIIKK